MRSHDLRRADLAANAFPAFTVNIEDESGDYPSDEDGSLVRIVVRNKLPCVSAGLEARSLS